MVVSEVRCYTLGVDMKWYRLGGAGANKCVFLYDGVASRGGATQYL